MSRPDYGSVYNLYNSAVFSLRPPRQSRLTNEALISMSAGRLAEFRAFQRRGCNDLASNLKWCRWSETEA